MIKDPQSKWQLGDRSYAWLKIKPDYIESPDIDAVRNSASKVAMERKKLKVTMFLDQQRSTATRLTTSVGVFHECLLRKQFAVSLFCCIWHSRSQTLSDESVRSGSTSDAHF